MIYSKLLGDKLSVNLGYVFENMVAQMLRANGHRLFYHTFLREDGKNYPEVDSLIADGGRLKRVEVKASGDKAHVSIDRFCEKDSSRVERSYIVYTKDLRKEGNTFYLPIYMTMFL